MHKITAGLVGAASASASLLLLRPLPEVSPASPQEPEPSLKGIHAGETVPAEISLRRLRELGL